MGIRSNRRVPWLLLSLLLLVLAFLGGILLGSETSASAACPIKFTLKLSPFVLENDETPTGILPPP